MRERLISSILSFVWLLNATDGLNVPRQELGLCQRHSTAFDGPVMFDIHRIEVESCGDDNAGSLFSAHLSGIIELGR